MNNDIYYFENFPYILTYQQAVQDGYLIVLLDKNGNRIAIRESSNGEQSRIYDKEIEWIICNLSMSMEEMNNINTKLENVKKELDANNNS